MTDGCYQCHGVGGNGAALSGPKLSQTGLPFDAFMTQLRQPSNEMPPYEAAVVPDQTVADIYAYVKSLPGSPAAKDIPLLMNMGLK
jgi:ubiquinol-cytochrome c reductase cytochrome c subunit